MSCSDCAIYAAVSARYRSAYPKPTYAPERTANTAPTSKVSLKKDRVLSDTISPTVRQVLAARR